MTMSDRQHLLAVFLSDPQFWDPEELASWQQVHEWSVGEDDVSLGYAGFLLARRILHGIHDIYIDFAHSPAHLHRLLQAWNVFAHISQLVNHSQSSRILRAGVFFTSICQADIEEMVPLDCMELYDILLTGYSLATREERAVVANNTALDWGGFLMSSILSIDRIDGGTMWANWSTVLNPAQMWFLMGWDSRSLCGCHGTIRAVIGEPVRSIISQLSHGSLNLERVSRGREALSACGTTSQSTSLHQDVTAPVWNSSAIPAGIRSKPCCGPVISQPDSRSSELILMHRVHRSSPLNIVTVLSLGRWSRRYCSSLEIVREYISRVDWRQVDPICESSFSAVHAMRFSPMAPIVVTPDKTLAITSHRHLLVLEQ
ncbi:hypothetical protein HD553DRAFT_323512 [Filobasidium floriforme]|uniref:uncharacterized protein n=1 Tax=Filobasidium floriforme TaxID=5210 RepID=UPI001E8D4D20|nr:uncharacterized protein HD553DRAFT_323512 [Filobasidium floriforme]KAH8086585.1 hypothetical protein HD553DRAFT_323512 [Filobasidium floriforme]